jgi:hypothetical protein
MGRQPILTGILITSTTSIRGQKSSFQNTDIIERREIIMCEHCCGHQEKLKEEPEKCSEEQIRDCHGDNKDHPCKDENK